MGKESDMIAVRVCLENRREVAAPSPSPPPAEREQHERADGHAAQARLDGKMRMLGDIAQQERDTEEKYDDANTGDEVAAGEEFADLAQPREIRDRRERSGRLEHGTGFRASSRGRGGGCRCDSWRSRA